MRTFIYTIQGKRSLGLIIVRCRTLAFAIMYVQARMTEDLGKVFFADEKDFVVLEKDFEGVVWSDCGNEHLLDVAKDPEIKWIGTRMIEPAQETKTGNYLRRQNVV